MRLGDLDALKSDLKQYFSDGTLESVSAKLAFNMILRKIDEAPTVEPNNEYGAIQYSNGFNDGFTTAKDTIIQNIAEQYSAHGELVPTWLRIGDLKSGAEE